ncbi:hypothetical protein [Kutzneria buriramensis]|uniref:Uncharacterized protein n=1 Tax=Kutzneria buriramensis TaxID=1045776 RepID=A0A3E0GYE9_9PSEU|nr:hypothetical protein [Kutzneria buriramensis]REH34775.1 hypothetical protein BCF44_11951 [Kutzneria buriramensis]
MTGPDFVMWLDTRTAMYDGSVPADVSLKPLKLAGADPPLRELAVHHHWVPQNVTAPVALRSPTTNEPPWL